MAIKIQAESGKPIHIGRVGENLATDVFFNVEKQLFFGNEGTFKVLVSQDDQLSEITTNLLLNTTNKTLCWTITDNETIKKGKGRCQLVYTLDTLVSKSEIYDFIVTETIKGDE